MLAALAFAALLGAGCAAAAAFSKALAEAHRRVSGRSALIRTRFGRLEYAVAGQGPPPLMLHGTGGGFDQGLRVSAGIVARGVRVVAPSRFGHLRSDFPPDPSSEDQADALVELLDRLGLDRLPVAGGSAGALAAVQFALRHPGRCSGLVLLVPAANLRGRDPVDMGRVAKVLVERLLTSDPLFWAALNTIPGRLVGALLATDPGLLRRAPPAERRRARATLEDLMPIGARRRGILNDARLAGSPARVDFGRLRVPTLVVSVEDDRFGTAAPRETSPPRCRGRGPWCTRAAATSGWATTMPSRTRSPGSFRNSPPADPAAAGRETLAPAKAKKLSSTRRRLSPGHSSETRIEHGPASNTAPPIR